MKKRFGVFMSLLAVLLCAFALVACGGGGDNFKKFPRGVSGNKKRAIRFAFFIGVLVRTRAFTKITQYFFTPLIIATKIV